MSDAKRLRSFATNQAPRTADETEDPRHAGLAFASGLVLSFSNRSC